MVAGYLRKQELEKERQKEQQRVSQAKEQQDRKDQQVVQGASVAKEGMKVGQGTTQSKPQGVSARPISNYEAGYVRTDQRQQNSGSAAGNNDYGTQTNSGPGLSVPFSAMNPDMAAGTNSDMTNQMSSGRKGAGKDSKGSGQSRGEEPAGLDTSFLLKKKKDRNG